MEFSFHDFTNLFAQLGLPNDPESIQRFIKQHAPLDPNIRLEDAPFWNASQAALLRDNIINDADWAQVADRLNAVMRKGIP